jgi:hypothetical protein
MTIMADVKFHASVFCFPIFSVSLQRVAGMREDSRRAVPERHQHTTTKNR